MTNVLFSTRQSRRTAVLLCFFLLPLLAAAQTPVSLTGRVTDQHGLPLPGVTVRIKGSQISTATDKDGGFRLRPPVASPTLIFSFIGYQTYEVVADGKTRLDIQLNERADKLNEVVVIGYGTTVRRDLTGSVSSVEMADLKLAPVKSFDEALQGRVAGVQVSSNDGQPGSSPNIVIRGGSSITQDNSPLYVVDGFPIENYNNNAINPEDIEAIDILKDASATAIYGARGANGVIIITTRRGKAGDPAIAYNGYYGLQRDIRRMEVLSPYEFVKLQLEADGSGATTTYLTSQNRTLDDYRNITGINWYEKVMRTAGTQSHSLSLSGGTPKTKYSMTGSILDQQGIFLNTGFKRYQGRVTLDQNVNDKLKVGITANYSEAKDYGTIAANGDGTILGLMASIWGYRPVLTDPANTGLDYEDQLTDPALNQSSDYRVNPFLQLQNEYRQRNSRNLQANGLLNYAIDRHLSLNITGGISNATAVADAFYNSLTRTGSVFYPQSLGPNGSSRTTGNINLSNENTLSYHNTFAKFHQLNVLAGFSMQSNQSSEFGAAAIQVANESLGVSGLDEGTPQTIVSGRSNWFLQSYLSRLNYSYKSRYLLTATFRADGSSKFAQGHKWGYFPSAAFAYRLSSEPFMKTFTWLSDTKIRASYGATGNNRVGDFSYLSSIATARSSGYSFGNATPLRGTFSSGLGNPDLKWETTRQLDLGIDVSLWKGRFSFTGDYYEKKTDDLLLNAQLPYASGYNTAFKNIGSVSNKGIELTLNSTNIESKGFTWTSSFNIAFNRNKVLSLTENQESLTSLTGAAFSNNPVFIAKIGQPVAMFYGVIFDGVYQYSDFDRLTNGTYILKDNIPTNGNARASIRPGDAKYRDLNNDGNINTNDYTIIGNPNPDFTGGLTNNFRYRGFDLSVFLQFSSGNQLLNANRAVFENLAIPNLNQFASYADRWTVTNPGSDIPRYGGSGQNLYTTRLIEDGSYLRLKTVSFGYSLPAGWLKTLSLKSTRVYVTAQNLITITGYSGLDPEVSSRNSNLTPGLDWSPFPRSRTFVFGLSTSF